MDGMFAEHQAGALREGEAVTRLTMGMYCMDHPAGAQAGASQIAVNATISRLLKNHNRLDAEA